MSRALQGTDVQAEYDGGALQSRLAAVLDTGARERALDSGTGHAPAGLFPSAAAALAAAATS